MDQTANSSPENKRYNDESMLLDGLYEFHPEFFDQLNKDELSALQTYYLVGQEVPENIFAYRAALILKQPRIEPGAQAAFAKLCRVSGIRK